MQTATRRKYLGIPSEDLGVSLFQCSDCVGNSVSDCHHGMVLPDLALKFGPAETKQTTTCRGHRHEVLNFVLGTEED